MSTNAFIFVSVLLPIILYLLFSILRSINLKRKWQLAKQKHLTEHDIKILVQKFKPYQFLSSEERSRFESKINYILIHKRIEGIGPLKLSEEMKLLIAAQASLMIVNLDIDEPYPGLTNIYVMEGSYIEIDNPVNPSTGVPYHVPRLGESRKRGPIILSWDSIEESIKFSPRKHNLIIHEFSHQLDQQDGHFDGTPQFQTDKQYELWARVMGDEFFNLRTRILHHKSSDISEYGATNEAEFFSVCTEYYFTDPVNLYEKHPAIFEIYLDFFKIDPRRWHY